VLTGVDFQLKQAVFLLCSAPTVQVPSLMLSGTSCNRLKGAHEVNRTGPTMTKVCVKSLPARPTPVQEKYSQPGKTKI